MWAFLGEFIGSIVWSILLLPLSLIFSTPLILIISFRGNNGYLNSLKKNYKIVIDWWKKNS